MGQSNEETIELRMQIRNCASEVFNLHANHLLLTSLQQLMTQRAYLAYLIDRDLIKDVPLAIEQFKQFNELIKKHLSL